jgi:anti-anti-sigma factor
MEDDLVVVVDREADRCRIGVSGDLSVFTCRNLSDAVAAEMRDGAARIELDLSAVEFMDSSGVQCLVEVHRSATEAGAFLVVGAMANRVQRILEITGLLGVLRPDEPSSQPPAA